MPDQKKMLCMVLCLFCLLQHVQAHDNGDSTQHRKKSSFKIHHQVGINIAPFFDRFLKFNNLNTNTSVAPYLFSYRLQFCKRSVVRIGLGGAMDDDEITGSTSSNPRNLKSSAFDFALGYEYYILQNRKWKAGAGISSFIHRQRSTSHQIDNPSQTDFIQTDKNSSWGSGPTLSIQFAIGNRVSLGTEGGFYYGTGTTTSATVVTGSFPSNSFTNSKQTHIVAQYPTSLFINFNF